MWEYTYTNELYHHGILGQRWGIRRYQNKDGTLTAAGKRRADKLRNEYLTLTGKSQVRGNKTKATSNTDETTSKKKSVSEMSDDDLQKAINRKRLEQQYSQLNPKQVSAGKKLCNEVILPALKESGKKTLSAFMEKEMKKALGLNDQKTKSTYEKLKEEYDILDYTKKIKDLKNPKTKSNVDKLKEEWLELDYTRRINDLKKQK